MRGQSGLDLVLFVVIIFVCLILGFVVLKMWNGINTGIQNNSAIVGNATAQGSADIGTGIAHGFNNGIVVGVFIIYIGLFITARYIGTEPMFFIVNICLLIFALAFAAVYANVFAGFTNSLEFVNETASLPAAVFIGEHLLLFGIGAFAIILIGLFAKPADGVA
jgi:hypothetical protein